MLPNQQRSRQLQNYSKLKVAYLFILEISLVFVCYPSSYIEYAASYLFLNCSRTFSSNIFTDFKAVN